jgi:UDP-N-acetylmuramoylalanine--D-glutamate ligase
MGVSSQNIVKALTSFKGVKHRLEEVGVVSGVKYIDDSKGTNVDATIKAVACMKGETVLLLGGKDKGYNYDALFDELKKSCVTHAILYGENRYALLQSARAVGFENISVCACFSMAARFAAMVAKKGQTVLLSPASASFDEFANYEERGGKFVEIVRQIAQEAKDGKEGSTDENRALDEAGQDK